MKSHNAIQNELRELGSSLPPHIESPVFDLPDGYFENFAASVLAKLKGEPEMNAHEELKSLSPTLSALPRKMPFSVPENYFSGLTNELSTIINDDPLPMELQLAGKKVPYDVPIDYFEKLPEQILRKVTKQGAKVIAIHKVRWIKVAAAAMIIGVIALSSIFLFRNGGQKITDVDPQSGSWIATKLKNISTKELEEFIRTTDAGTVRKEVAHTTIKKIEVNKLLNDVPDSELDAFLSAVPSDTEDPLTIN